MPDHMYIISFYFSICFTASHVTNYFVRFLSILSFLLLGKFQILLHKIWKRKNSKQNFKEITAIFDDFGNEWNNINNKNNPLFSVKTTAIIKDKTGTWMTLTEQLYITAFLNVEETMI